MDAGTIFAIIWGAALLGLVVVAAAGELQFEASVKGVCNAIGLIVFLISTLACVWIAAGLHLSVS